MPSSNQLISANAARQIGLLLRDARKRRHLTGEELAKQLGISQSRIAKLENGYPETIANMDISRVIEILNPSKTIRQHLEVLLQSDAPGVGAHLKYIEGGDAEALRLERQATQVRVFAVNAIPALLQTPEYRKAVFERHGVSADALPFLMQETLKRQDALWDETRTVHCIIPEAALYTMYIAGAGQLTQLDRLERVMQIPQLSFGILPLEAGMALLETGSFVVYDADKAVVVMGDVETESTEPIMVAKYSVTFAELERKAVYADEAVALVRKASDYFGR